MFIISRLSNRCTLVTDISRVKVFTATKVFLMYCVADGEERLIWKYTNFIDTRETFIDKGMEDLIVSNVFQHARSMTKGGAVWKTKEHVKLYGPNGRLYWIRVLCQ